MNPTNRCTKDDVIRWITPTLEKENLKNYTINISGSSAKGDGYLGDITFVQVKGDEKVYNFVVKCGKKSTELRGIMPVREAFQNEIYFYENVLPVFRDFQAEKGVKEPFQHHPRCYDTLLFEDMEVLILEDVKWRGYVLHDRKTCIDDDSIRMVMKVYGKLHAISFALRDQRPEVFAKLSGNLIDVLTLMRKSNKIEDAPNRFENIIKAAKEEGEEEVAEKSYLLDKTSKEMKEQKPADSYAVILHGDCWNNNFLYQHDKEKLSNVCLIDFQISRLASPVQDLSYFLFTCLSDKNVSKFDHFLDVYYESFSSFLAELGSDPNKMFPFEELQNQWKKFGTFGLIMMPSIVNICLSEADEVPDLVEAAETGTNLAAMFGKSVRSEKEYRNRTVPIMKLAISKGIV